MMPPRMGQRPRYFHRRPFIPPLRPHLVTPPLQGGAPPPPFPPPPLLPTHLVEPLVLQALHHLHQLSLHTLHISEGSIPEGEEGSTSSARPCIHCTAFLGSAPSPALSSYRLQLTCPTVLPSSSPYLVLPPSYLLHQVVAHNVHHAQHLKREGEAGLEGGGGGGGGSNGASNLQPPFHTHARSQPSILCRNAKPSCGRVDAGAVSIPCTAPHTYCPTTVLPSASHLLGQTPEEERQRSTEEGTLTAGQLIQRQPQLQAGRQVGGKRRRA